MHKYLFLIIFFIISYVSFCQKEIENCYNSNGCSNVPWSEYVLTVNYPGFPDCDITVGVQARVCNGQTQIWIKYYHFWSLNYYNCFSYLDWLYYPNDWRQQNNSPDPEKVKLLYKYAYENVAQQLFIQFTNSQKSLFLCDNPPYYPEWANFTYYKTACNSICVVAGLIHGEEQLRIHTSACSNDCCQIKLSYCWPSINATEPITDRQVLNSMTTGACSSLPIPQCGIDYSDFDSIIYQRQGECYTFECN